MHLFHRMIFFSSLLWTISLLFILYIQAFHPILKENSSKYTKYRTPKKGKLPDSIFQSRTGVSKDLWLSSETKRTHYHLESPSSTLQFIPKRTQKGEIFEVGATQFDQAPAGRYVKALLKTGLDVARSKSGDAGFENSPLLSSFRYKPDLTETLSQVKLWMDDEYFQANETTLHYTTHEMTALGPIAFDKGETHIRSKSASLLLKNKKPSSFMFENDVTLTNGSIKCATDSLIYDIKEGSLKGLGKVVFTLQSDDVWKKKTS